MTILHGSYDLMLASPPEYSGAVCPQCEEPSEFPQNCNRCDDCADSVEFNSDVAALVRLARQALASGYRNVDLVEVLRRFPETEERAA